MGRNNKDKLNYKVVKTSQDGDKEQHKFCSRREVELFICISASTMLKMINTEKMKVVDKSVYQVYRICENMTDNLIQSL